MKQHKAQCFFCSPYNSHIHSKIESAILRNEFSQESHWGFRILMRRSHFLQALYIEKQIVSEKITDPFGESVEFNRLIYHQITFQLSVSSPHILIFQPPKNYRKLINQLAQFTEYNIAVENKSVQLFDWIDLLSNEGMEGIVTKVNIDPIKYDNRTIGKLLLTGHDDVRKKIDELLPGKLYKIKNAKIIFKNNKKISDAELYATGKVILSKSVDPSNFEVFYNTFCTLI